MLHVVRPHSYLPSIPPRLVTPVVPKSKMPQDLINIIQRTKNPVEPNLPSLETNVLEQNQLMDAVG